MNQKAQAKITNRTSSPNQNGTSICTVTCPKCNHSRTVSYGGWTALACVCGVELTRFAAKAVPQQAQQKITFSKMENDQWGDSGEMHIYIGEQCYGYIEKFSSAVDVGSVQTHWKYTVCGYTVTVWTDANDDIPEQEFDVKDYATARTALAAAKQWARETIRHNS